VSSQIINLITMAQNITLSVDGRDVETKHDPRRAALSLKQLGHFCVGMVALSMAVGLVLSVSI